MEIILNNRKEYLNESEISISRLIELKRFSFKMIIFKINGEVIPREDYAATFINDGDKVDAIHLISGG